jgi:hypothetical protein
MSGVHAINLTNAWETEPGGAAGGTTWVRRFGRPAGLAAGDAVWLVIVDPAACTLALNGTPLPEGPPNADRRVEITPLLRDRNLLVVVPQVPGPAEAPATGRLPLPEALGRVWLEIVPAAAAPA